MELFELWNGNSGLGKRSRVTFWHQDAHSLHWFFSQISLKHDKVVRKSTIIINLTFNNSSFLPHMKNYIWHDVEATLKQCQKLP